ncbi:MAG: hypothetical protein ACE5IY_13935 [bacterium]
MSETYKIVEKNGKKHLIQTGLLLGDTDHGELHESLLGGKLYTTSFWGTSFELIDDSFFSSGSQYEAKKSNGEKGIMRKSWSGDTYVYYKERKPIRKINN